MELLWYILLYSVAGFGIEILYARCVGARKQDRKCLLVLPMCPVYGIGAALILSLPQFIRQNVLFLLPAAALTATAAEYLMSLFYEKVWKVSFWDYSELKGNLHGRVCLPFSVAWSFLSVPLVYWVHPLIERLIHALPDTLLIGAVLAFTADSLVTGWLLRKTASTDVLKWYKKRIE